MKEKEAQGFEGKLSRKEGEEAEERPNRPEIRLMQQFVFGNCWLHQTWQFQGVYQKLHEAVGLRTMPYRNRRSLAEPAVIVPRNCPDHRLILGASLTKAEVVLVVDST